MIEGSQICKETQGVKRRKITQNTIKKTEGNITKEYDSH